ncbi:EexN family lipoprotein [Pantoea septica]|uniref:EexN family lipoprotein n=1 Tax=Pantoea septica TaxID=472695 RepID=UPI003D06B9F9
MKKRIAFSAILIALAGCKDEVHDKDYYYKNLGEARTVAQKCQDEQMSGDNCSNAKAALYLDSQKNGKVMHN